MQRFATVFSRFRIFVEFKNSLFCEDRTFTNTPVLNPSIHPRALDSVVREGSGVEP